MDDGEIVDRVRLSELTDFPGSVKKLNASSQFGRLYSLIEARFLIIALQSLAYDSGQGVDQGLHTSIL